MAFEKQTASKTVFKGKIINVRLDDVLLENGHSSTREVVEHRGGACALAINDKDEVYLVRQFRYPYSKDILEVPAGKLEQGEPPDVTIRRELREEVGISDCTLTFLGEIYPSVGYTNEVIYPYLATNVTQGENKLDEDEFLDVVKMPFEQALAMVDSGALPDAKTQIVLLKAARLSDKQNAK